MFRLSYLVDWTQRCPPVVSHLMTGARLNMPFIARGLKITRKTAAPQEQHTLNEQIKVFMVRLVDDAGKVRDIHTKFALDEARKRRMDLMVINDKVDPPLCKILNYGKFKYDQAQKKKSIPTQAKPKELRFGSKIEEHDVSVKVKQLEKFLLKKIRVKISITFDKGAPDKALAEAMIDNLFERVATFTKKDPILQISGKVISVFFLPIADKVDRELALRIKMGQLSEKDLEQTEDDDDGASGQQDTRNHT